MVFNLLGFETPPQRLVLLRRKCTSVGRQYSISSILYRYLFILLSLLPETSIQYTCDLYYIISSVAGLEGLQNDHPIIHILET